MITSLFQVIQNVKSMEDQVRFYRDVLGLKVVYPAEIKDTASETFVRFETGGAYLVLHSGRKTDNAGQEPRLSFRVENLTQSREFLVRSGVEAGPLRNPAPNVYVVDCKDPEGNTFHLEADRLD